MHVPPGRNDVEAAKPSPKADLFSPCADTTFSFVASLRSENCAGGSKHGQEACIGFQTWFSDRIESYMSGDHQIPPGRAPEQLIAFAQQLKHIREHVIQV